MYHVPKLYSVLHPIYQPGRAKAKKQTYISWNMFHYNRQNKRGKERNVIIYQYTLDLMTMFSGGYPVIANSPTRQALLMMNPPELNR